MKTAIVKYNAGNVASVMNALFRLGAEAVVSDDPSVIAGADRIIFPGVGEASTAMKYLRERRLDQVMRSAKQPVLGICLGMQLLCSHSEENDTAGLDIFPNAVCRFRETGLKVPHIGWNTISGLRSPLFDGIDENAYVYFVHGYFAERSDLTAATTEYGRSFSSALQHENFYAVQFHPERSGTVGERILRNFLSL